MGNFPLHSYDVVMLLILAVATFFGLWKGLAWQVASVASFVLSYFVAVQGSSSLAPLLPLQAPWNHLAAMLILFVATSAAVWLVFRLVAGLIDKIQLKAFDRQLGALLGLFKGVLICLVVTFFAVTLSEALRQEVLRARSGYYIALLIDRLKPVLPAEVRDLVGKYLEELDQKLRKPPDGGVPQENRPAAPASEGLFPPAALGDSSGGFAPHQVPMGQNGPQTPESAIGYGIDGPTIRAPPAAEAAEFFSRQWASENGLSPQPGRGEGPFLPSPNRSSDPASSNPAGFHPSSQSTSDPSQPRDSGLLAPLVPIR